MRGYSTVSALAEDRADFVPQRWILMFAIGFRRRRLRGAHRVGRRKRIHQTVFEFLVCVTVGFERRVSVDEAVEILQARAVLEENRGATARTVELLAPLLKQMSDARCQMLVEEKTLTSNI